MKYTQIKLFLSNTKRKNKENADWDERLGKIIEITKTEERRIDMKVGVGKEHIYETPISKRRIVV